MMLDFGPKLCLKMLMMKLLRGFEMKTVVVNKKYEDFDVYIGRGSRFGNPFCIGRDGDRDLVIKKYRGWFTKKLEDPQFKEAVLALKGKRLGCYCKPLPCHGDIIAKYLDGLC